MTKGLIFATIITFVSTTYAQIDIYNEDFDAGVPVGFTIVDNDGLTPNAAVSEYTSAWIRVADPENTSDTVMGSTSYFDPVGQADRWLITPGIALGDYGNRFYWEARSHDASFPDTYYVLISSTDTQLSSFTDTIGYVVEEFATWTFRDVDLSSYGFNNTTVYIAFVNRTNDGFKLYIDDLRAEKESDLSLPNLDELSVSIYPNPTKDQLFVNVQGFVSLEITALDGASVMTSNTSKVNVSELSEGAYFVKISTESGEVVRKFIKN